MALNLKLAPAAAAILLGLALGACAHSGSDMASSSRQTETAAAPSAASPSADDSASSSADSSMASPQATAPVSPTSPTPPPASTTASFTDVQLQAFARASVEVDRVQARHQAAMSGTPEQQAAARTAMSTELSAILQRNNIDSTTYNNIARAARTDAALAQRITTLRAQAGATPG